MAREWPGLDPGYVPWQMSEWLWNISEAQWDDDLESICSSAKLEFPNTVNKKRRMRTIFSRIGAFLCFAFWSDGV